MNEKENNQYKTKRFANLEMDIIYYTICPHCKIRNDWIKREIKETCQNCKEVYIVDWVSY